ncbi:MAG: hypothetical protein M0036_26725 [Desulfobacteraceae bacterium]|nr:hypothetical protein [Desulfobacteraceae bacterium]
MFYRKVSPIERVFTLLHEMDKPFSNQVVLEGTGVLDVSRWEKAVAAACEANPGSRLVYRGISRWAKWVDSGVAAPIVQVDGSHWDALSSDGAPFLLTSLPFKETHSCEVVLLTGNPLRVVFRTLHATMDGRGTQLWIEDIFRALRGEPLLGASSSINDAEFVAGLSAPKRWERKKRNCLAPTGPIDGSEPGNVWRRTRVKGKFSKLLPQVAIAIGKEARKQGPCNVCFNVPVDLRARAGAARSTANLTRRIILYIPPDATPESVQQHMLEKLNDMSRDPEILKIAYYIPLKWIELFFVRFRKRNLGSGWYYSTGTLSNLGRLPIEAYEGGGFKADTGFYIPPGTEGKPLFVTLAGCGEFIEVIISMPKTLASNGRIDQLLDRIVSQLKPNP